MGTSQNRTCRRQAWWSPVARSLAGACVIVLVMGSAVMTKRTAALPALAGIERTASPARQAEPLGVAQPAAEHAAERAAEGTDESGPTTADGVEVVRVEEITEDSPEWDLATRWFDGRPVRPARVVLMRVTAYSPDHRSCGAFADGQTATLHSVWTNGMRLVAADPTVLPYGSMLTVPGYADDEIVPVLDCGGAIKGARLDVLYPTHETARNWGVRDLRVVVWEYADGKPAPNPRKVR